MKHLTIIIAFIALGLSGVCLYQISSLQNELNASKEVVIEEEHNEEEHEEEEYEIADVMNKVQRHYNKLYFAGMAENWELAEFYIEETEEALEGLAEANVMEDGVNVSALVMSKGFEPLEQVEIAVKAKDKTQFLQAYNLQIEQCNSCHALTKHAFIKIKTPETPAFNNQVYTP